MTIIQEVHKELNELKRLGVRVPKAAFKSISEAEADDYVENGMSISEIADMAIALS